MRSRKKDPSDEMGCDLSVASPVYSPVVKIEMGFDGSDMYGEKKKIK